VTLQVALGSHEGLSHPDRLRDPRSGCPRWPEGLWLLSDQGVVVPGRCKSTNLCTYCAVQAAHENARMLSIDAEDHLDQCPQLVAIVGTRTATEDPRPFYEGRRLVIRALRRRWPAAEYASQCEFTTGKGTRSGGQRRPHWNILLKGIPAGGVDDAREIVRRVWCEHVDAEPEAQYVERLESTAAFMRYVALHFQKESQAPPHGWRGQRFNCSRGYFTERTRAEARQVAREQLQLERDLWRAEQQGAPDPEAAAAAAAADRAERTWELWRSPRPRIAPGADWHVPAFITEAAWRWREREHA